MLLGMQPADADGEVGYIVPGAIDPDGGLAVAQFIEKPSILQAREIIARGGLWNTFIFAASARTLLHLFVARFAKIVVDMQLLLSRYLTSSHDDPTLLMDFYERLPHLDFSRDVLEDRPASLCVLRVPARGWSDLGTPKRIAQTLSRVNQARFHMEEDPSHPSNDYLSLALQYRRRELPQQEAGYGKF